MAYFGSKEDLDMQGGENGRSVTGKLGYKVRGAPIQDLLDS